MTLKSILNKIAFEHYSKLDCYLSSREMHRGRRYVWPGMHRVITRWCKAYQDCQQSKVTRHNYLVPTQFVAPDGRFRHVHMDIVGPLPESDGYIHCLTMIDRFSRCRRSQTFKKYRGSDGLPSFCVLLDISLQRFRYVGIVALKQQLCVTRTKIGHHRYQRVCLVLGPTS